MSARSRTHKGVDDLEVEGYLEVECVGYLEDKYDLEVEGMLRMTVRLNSQLNSHRVIK